MTAVRVARRGLATERRASDVRDFGTRPGALVAVCGLHGGAGATALTAAAASAAASASAPGAVLAVEADARAGDLAPRLGIASPWPLAAVAEHVAAGRAPEAPPFAERHDGLRVLAAAEPTTARADIAAVTAVLAEARRAHGLVVVDAGTLHGDCAAACLPASDVVLWTAHGVRLADAIGRLTGPLVRPGRGAQWLLAVVGARASRKTLAPVREDLAACLTLARDTDAATGDGQRLLAAISELLP